jgi:hypothetical protein
MQQICTNVFRDRNRDRKCHTGTLIPEALILMPREHSFQGRPPSKKLESADKPAWHNPSLLNKIDFTVEFWKEDDLKATSFADNLKV